MLTAERSRELLRGVRTVIVDEIHALARDKRGAHLALTLERLEHVARQRPVRIGLSATQRPIETRRAAARRRGRRRSDAAGVRAARSSTSGTGASSTSRSSCPSSELEAVASTEQIGRGARPDRRARRGSAARRWSS